MNTKDWKPEFRERYLKHADELRWLYCELYHNDLQAFDYFTEMMYQAYLARPERLKLMDRAREARSLTA